MKTKFILFGVILLIAIAFVSAAKPAPPSSICTDSDSGIFPNIPGYIQTSSGVLTDSCSGNNIIERYCTGTTGTYTTLSCSGTCNPQATSVKISKKTYWLAACEENLCGNNVLNTGEQCDNGASNGASCTAPYSGTCQYCSSNCQIITNQGPRCGDGILQSSYEQCDSGSLNTNTPCTPPAGGSCSYCNTTCKTNTVISLPTCTDNIKNGAETDIDCGGGVCPVCNPGKNCLVNSDCVTNNCTSGICVSVASTTIYGTIGNDIFQLKFSHIYLNGVDKGAVVPGIALYGLGGNDTFTTIGGGNQIIYGGDGHDSFWLDSNDIIMDATNDETSGLVQSPLPSIHVVNSYYQPWTTNSASPDYVSFETNGQRIKEPDISQWSGAQYANCSGLLFLNNTPKYTNPLQGNIGNCYFIASLNSLAYSDPELIKQMIVDLGDGTYVVRFYNTCYQVGNCFPGQVNYLKIDSYLPVDSYGYLLMDHGGDNCEWPVSSAYYFPRWSALLEKAYAYYRFGNNSYHSLESGLMRDVYYQLTNSTAKSSTYSFNSNQLVSFFDDKFMNGYATSSSSYIPFYPTEVYSRHAYANMNLSLNTSHFVLMGPYNFTVGKANIIIRNDNTNGEVIVDAIRIWKNSWIYLDNNLTNSSIGSVQITGTWLKSNSLKGYYGTDYLSDGNAGKGSKSVSFIPNITALGSGSYYVFINFIPNPNGASSVPVDIVSLNGTQRVYVNQKDQRFLFAWNPWGSNHAELSPQDYKNSFGEIDYDPL